MNNDDRRFLFRIQECLYAMSGMSPSNPCDTRAIFAAHRDLVAASRGLFLAITCHGFGDHDDRDDRMRTAETILGINAPAAGDQETAS